METTGPQHARPGNGPIVANWEFKKAAGKANLIVYPDGRYLFSGDYKQQDPGKGFENNPFGIEPGRDFEIVLALKSTLGGILQFHYVGNMSKGGVQWSKEGQDAILKDSFKSFAGPHDWSGSFRLPLHGGAKAAESARDAIWQDCYKVLDAWTGFKVPKGGGYCKNITFKP